ncbi:MAG TPA: hypothetical protein VJK29_11345 [Terriglobales bacterium]|nr:hypothetical protein [Terriglobales bacterium]
MAAPVPPPPVPPAAPPAPVRYDLRIEALFNVRGRWPKPRFAIQNEPFHLVLRFANTGATVFPGCRVRGIHIQVTGESQPLSSNIREEFAIPVLNPGQSTELEVGRFNLAFEGVTWVGCSLVPAAPNIEITTYQVDASSGDVSPYQQINEWGNVWFMQRQMEVQQARTNNLIMLLTLLLVLETLFGLKNIVMDLLHFVQAFLLWLAHLI